MSVMNNKNQFKSGFKSALESEFIREYLLDKGFYLEDLETMSEEDAKHLMVGACRFASLKLAEMESRAKFREKIHEIYQHRG